MKTAIFVFEAAQVALLPRLLETAGQAVEIIACGADIEFLLEEKKIPFRSARTMLTMHPYERLAHCNVLSQQIMETKAFAFFKHRDIDIAALFTPTLFYYLTYFLYYLDLIISTLETNEYYNAVLIPSQVTLLPAAGLLAEFNLTAFADALTLVCRRKHITLQKYKNVKRKLFGLSLSLLNGYMRFFVPHKKIRLLGSEMWKNINTLMDELPDSELILIDRAEALKIGWRTIIKHRMQFVHADSFAPRSVRLMAHKKTLEFKATWQTEKQNHTKFLEYAFRNYSLTKIFDSAIERFLDDSERVIRDIDATFAMYKHLQPTVVMVRAGTSAHTHFPIMCEVARQLHIPSLEIQHGIFSIGRETETSNRAAEYIAEYGPHERELWQKHGYAKRSTFIDIGSPRFDPFISNDAMRKPLNDGNFKILNIAPPWYIGAFNDSWDILEYFRTTANAVRGIPNAKVTIKLRATNQGEVFYREAIKRAFGDVPYDIVLYESLVELFPKADIVVSCHSTALLEALLSHKPLILDASLPVYTELARNDFEAYRNAGAFEVAETQDELRLIVQKLASNESARTLLSNRAATFMHEKFLFEDGKSSKRLADFIQTLAKK
jgi:hypothetical protein